MSESLERARTAWRYLLAPALCYLLGFVVLTWPAVTGFGTHFLCDTGDGFANAWNLWWVGEAVADLRNPWFTDRLFHPDGVTLIAQTLNPFNGFLVAPLQDIAPLHVRYNLALLFGFVSTGLTTAWLIHYVLRGRSWTAAVTGGFAFTFSGYHFARAYGHLDLVSIEWVPLFVLAWLRLLDNARLRDALLAAAAFLLVKLCNDYYTLYCVLVGVLLIAHRAVSDPRGLFTKPMLGALGLFVALALASVGPFVVALWLANRGDPFVGSHDASVYGLDVLSPFVPTAHWRFAAWTEGYWSTLAHNPIESSSYLRYSLLVPAALAVLAPKRFANGFARGPWLLLAAGFWLLALGPVLRLTGEPFWRVPMPYTGLEEVLPPLRLSGVPLRMFVVTTLALTVCACAALPTLWRRLGPAGRLLLVALFLFETWPYSLPRSQVETPDWASALAAMPKGAVAGLKGDPVDMVLQTRFEHPQIAGYLARRPRSVNGRAHEQTRLLADGDARRLVEEFDARYLVIDKFSPHRDTLRKDFRWVFRGAAHDILVRSDDVLPSAPDDPRDCASGAAVELTIELDSDGAPHRLLVHAPADRGRRYRVGFALSTSPPIALHDGRTIPLAADALFTETIEPQNPLVSGHDAVLDASGRGTVDLRLTDRTELLGRTVFCCAVVLDPAAPLEYCRIGKAQPIELPR